LFEDHSPSDSSSVSTKTAACAAACLTEAAGDDPPPSVSTVVCQPVDCFPDTDLMPTLVPR
jgi:hypothetical protein